MAENSKYDFFMNELVSLEKQVYVYVQQMGDIFEANAKNEKKIAKLNKENEVLKLKIEELENKLARQSAKNKKNSNSSDGNISDIEKEELKTKISDLISKIDYHLRS